MILAPIYFVFSLLTFYYGAYCTLIDPTDELVIEEKKSRFLKLKKLV